MSQGLLMLIPDGLYMLEIDRLLRPGGYWVVSTPPISWKSSCKGLNSTIKNHDGERLAIEDVANRLCWEKVSDKGTVSVWRKPTDHLHCAQEAKLWRSPPLCTEDNPDSAWYRNISLCVNHLPRVDLVGDIAGGAMEKWPQRLAAVPPRITNGEIKGVSIQAYKHDYSTWKRRVEHYGTYLKDFSHRSYRNVMDMNAGFGGFAAAMSKYPVWVMNVVPANITDNTLGIIYERGLIGTYMDWCEAFSTYPRTYDLIHANGVFSLYIDRCGTLDILVEMDRILRPGGAAVIRDVADVVLKVKAAADRLRWRSRVVETDDGASDPQKLLIVDNALSLPDRRSSALSRKWAAEAVSCTAGVWEQKSRGAPAVGAEARSCSTRPTLLSSEPEVGGGGGELHGRRCCQTAELLLPIEIDSDKGKAKQRALQGRGVYDWKG